MYRFYIYNALPNVIGAEWNKFCYDIDYYYQEREVSPEWNSMVINYEKEKGRVFFREKLETTLTFTGNDYTWLDALRNDYTWNGRCRPRLIVIKEDGVIIWKGFFKVLTGMFNESQCKAEFSEFPVLDRYSRMLDNSQKEFNMLETVAQNILIDIVPYQFEETVSVLQFAANPGDPVPIWGNPPAFTTDYEDENGNTWTLYQLQYFILELTGAGVLHYQIVRRYRRDWTESEGSPGAEWEDRGEIYAGSSIKKWVRCYLGCQYPGTYVSQQYASPVPGFSNWTHTLDTSTVDETYENPRGRAFIHIIGKFVDEYTNLESTGMGVTPYAPCISQLLRSSTNPVHSGDNELEYLYLFQKSDLKGIALSSNAATKAPLTWEDIERWLKVMFNAYWDITDDNWLRIEHRKFYENGLSYSTEKVVGLNLLSEELWRKQIKNKNTVSYNYKNMPQYEHFEAMEQFNDEFIGKDIEYSSGCVEHEEDKNKVDYSLVNLSLDLQYIENNKEEIAKEGFVMVDTQYNEDEEKRQTVIADNAFTGEPFLNSNMSFPNLHEKYQKYGRVLLSGYMNGVLTDFESAEKHCIQEEITISLCNETFNPYKLVRTERGDGEVEAASLNLKTKDLTLTLKYDD